MTRIKLPWIAVALASLSFMPSCADQEESIIVAGAPAWTNECSVQVPTDVFLAFGFLDVRFGTEYLLPLQVENQLVSQQAEVQNSGIDNSEVQLVGADVRLSSPQNPALIDRLGPAFTDFSPSVPTDSIPGGGVKGALISVIPAATAELIAQERVERAVAAGAGAATDAERRAAEQQVLRLEETIVARVVLRGRRTGNARGSVGELEARAYEFPIRVCHGCLITCGDCSVPVDDNGDMVPDRTIVGVCPPSLVPVEPTSPTNISSFVGLTLNCGTAQDDLFAPNDGGTCADGAS